MADATHPKKQVSERRKQQNRQAQKNYRERQKQHMQALESLLNSQQQFSTYAVVNACSHGSTSVDTSPPQGRLETQFTFQHGLKPVSSSFVLARTESSVSNVRSLDVEASETCESQVEPQKSGSTGLTSLIQSPPAPPTLTIRGGSTRSEIAETPSGLPTSRLHAGQILNQLIREVEKLDEAVYNRIASGEITISQIFEAGLRVCSGEPVVPFRPSDELCRIMPSSDEEAPSAVSGGLRRAVTLRTDKILVPDNKMRVYAYSLPDVYANHLRLKQFNEVAAVRANAEILGLTFTQISNPETESPFYCGPISKDAAETICATKFQNVAPHLRPTASQIQHRHHPYIDVLPFPTFRQRFIDAVSLEPPLIDEDELCDDFESGGLICWGSYFGEGNRVTGSGAPWDMRSWEAQPWFLKKWWFLIGGSQGELFQQSHWWHEMRGDRVSAWGSW